jgi:hypothetical protein
MPHHACRNRDTLAVSPASMSDIGLFGPGGHCPVRLADTIPVPPIASIAATPGGSDMLTHVAWGGLVTVLQVRRHAQRDMQHPTYTWLLVVLVFV